MKQADHFSWDTDALFERGEHFILGLLLCASFQEAMLVERELVLQSSVDQLASQCRLRAE